MTWSRMSFQARYRYRAMAIGITTIIAMSASNSSALGQAEVETKQANVPAAITNAAGAQPFALAQPTAAMINRKQQRLRSHHLPGPTLELPGDAGAAPQAIPNPNTQTHVSAPGPNAPQAPGDVILLANRGLSDGETDNFTSTVSEPTVASNGSQVLITANWFAAFSRDGGATFTNQDPFNFFPDSPQGGFCCDQVAIYDHRNDVMIWFLQYSRNDGQTQNTIRVAVAAGADIAANRWRYYDFTPQGVGNWENQWFDFPCLALGERFLYVSTNVFNLSDTWTRSVVLRLPLEQLAAYAALDYRYFDRTDLFSIRPTQGATNTMFFGSHVNRALMRVIRWPEASNNYTTHDASVQAWTQAAGVSTAPGPDGNDWLGRSDSRMQMAVMGEGVIGFGWNVAQDANFPFPHTRIALLDPNNPSTVVAQPHLWNENLAFAYPAAAANGANQIGVSVAYGGGSVNASHAVGVLRRQGANWQWRLVATAVGTHSPNDNRWGDYLWVQPEGRGARPSWVASGYALNGGGTRNNIVVRFIRFGVEGPPLGGANLAEAAPQVGKELSELKAEVRALRASVEQLTEKINKDERP